MLKKKHNIHEKMKRILALLVLICFLCIYSTGQNSDCLKKEVFDTLVTIPADKKPNEAHITIEICYRKDNNINITLKRPYFISNGEKLTEQKAKRQGHQLFLKGISHYRIDLYEVKLNRDVHYEITDSLTLNFEATEKGYWVNDSIEFTFKFFYKKAGLKKGDIEKDVKIRFNLPDNPNPADLIKKEKKDTIPTPQVVDIEKFTDKIKLLKSGTAVLSEQADTVGLDLNCYDTISYYYNKIFDLFNKEGEDYKLYKNDKKLLSKRYLFYRTNFLYSYENCNNPKKSDFKESFDAVDKYLRKDLEIGSEGLEGNVINTNIEEPKIKRSFDLKDILFYVLAGFFVILVITYFYSKIKKKRK
jgi:hypothetical protein